MKDFLEYMIGLPIILAGMGVLWFVLFVVKAVFCGVSNEF